MKRDKWYWTYMVMMLLIIGMAGFEAGYFYAPGPESDSAISAFLAVCDVIMILLCLYLDWKAKP